MYLFYTLPLHLAFFNKIKSNQIKSNQTTLLAHIIQVVHFLGVTSVGGTLITLLGFLEPVKNKKEQ